MQTIKTVLLSIASLPHEGVASWTTEMNYLLERDNHIDYIIGPYSNIRLTKPKQFFVGERNFIDKLKCKINYINRFNPYLRALDEILKNEEQIILQVKDNFGLLKAVLRHIEKRKLRKRVYVQYQYHSFLPFSFEEYFYDRIDELVLLTQSTYDVFKKNIDSFPIKVAINGDGVDSNDFKMIAIDEKNKLRKALSISNEKIVFTWCSQDRKKKGLDFVLQIWEQLLETYGDRIQLNIIGLSREIHTDLKGVHFVGKISNKKLNSYYQLSDFYLFPSLCQEGFGLSLLEAVKSGCYCIASDNGAISEVLNQGKYGKLIANPNYLKEWVLEIEKSIKEYEINNNINPFKEKIPEDLFDIKDWYNRYNENILNAKSSFKHRYYL